MSPSDPAWRLRRLLQHTMHCLWYNHYSSFTSIGPKCFLQVGRNKEKVAHFCATTPISIWIIKKWVDPIRIYPWSECGGSNPGPHVPKKLWKTFLACLWPFSIVSARFYFLFGALKSTVSTYSAPLCGNQCGQKRFPPQSRSLSLAGTGSVFCCMATRFRAAAQRRLLPCVYPELVDRHKTFCGTSSKSNGSCPLQNGLSPMCSCIDIRFIANPPEDSFLATNSAPALLTVVTAVSVQL